LNAKTQRKTGRRKKPEPFLVPAFLLAGCPDKPVGEKRHKIPKLDCLSNYQTVELEIT
jgi:hypothetical protein